MFNIVARGHDAADGTLVKMQHPLNHPSLLRGKDRTVVMVSKQRGGLRIQFGILFFTAQQANNRVGGALAQRLVGGEETAAVENCQLVQGLDNDREANRGVEIPFWNMEAKPVCHQAEADHQQEAQA